MQIAKQVNENRNFPVNNLIKTAGLISLALTLASCDFRRVFDWVGLCEEQQVIGAMSPDGRYAAIVYKRSCGATTGWETFINIQPGRSKFRGGGKDVFFGIDGLHAIEVVWTDNSHILVECIRCKPDKIFKQETVWRDVAISYKSYGDQ